MGGPRRGRCPRNTDRARPKVVAILLGITFVLTLWGTVETVFANDSLVDPSLVEFAWGGIAPDPGTKAAGYVVRKYVLPEKKVLAIHRAIEPPNRAGDFRNHVSSWLTARWQRDRVYRTFQQPAFLRGFKRISNFGSD